MLSSALPDLEPRKYAFGGSTGTGGLVPVERVASPYVGRSPIPEHGVLGAGVRTAVVYEGTRARSSTSLNWTRGVAVPEAKISSSEGCRDRGLLLGLLFCRAGL